MFGFGRRKALLERIERLEREIAGVNRPCVYLGNNLVMTTLRRTGQRIFLDARDLSITPHVLSDGTWEDWAVGAFLGSLRDGMTVLDVGASVGCFLLPAAKIVGPRGRAFAVEPNPEVNRLLRQSVLANGLAGWTKIIEAAATIDRGPVTLNVSIAGSAYTSVVRPVTSADWASVPVVVPGDRLDHLLPTDTHIDVMKIDIEAGEFHAFQGMGALLDRQGAMTIFSEFRVDAFSPFVTPQQFLRDFEARGFSLSLVEPDGVSAPLGHGTILQRVGRRTVTLCMRR